MTARDFFSAIWRLGSQVDVLLKPSGFLGFPVLDFTEIDSSCLQVNAFNFTGVDSPLPHYLLELAIKSPAFANFLGIFNQQFYRLLYAVWQSGHPLAHQDLYQRLISRWQGFSESSEFSSYVDIWVLSPGIIALKKSLKRFLGVVPFAVREYPYYWFDLANLSRLGMNACLSDSMLGDRFFTNQYCVDCSIGPIALAESIDVSFLKKLLRYFAGDVKINLSLQFNGESLKLGNACLGSVRLFLVKQVFNIL